jgi:peptidoglycan hydrolase-like protein with peptidoglycan-binding domain
MFRRPVVLALVILGFTFAPPSADAATQWEVQQAQEMLNILGYNAGTEDGFMGARTRNAVRAFEADMGMFQTGIVDQSLLNALDRQIMATGGYPGSGVNPGDFALWLEDLVFEVDRSKAADSWVIDELYVLTDDFHALSPGADMSYYIANLETLVYDAESGNDAARWVIDELYLLLDDYYLAQAPVATWGWPTQILATDFRTAGNIHNAGVLLDAGNFYIDRYVGLVSQPANLDDDDGDLNGEELALAILGALLSEATNSNSGGNNNTGPDVLAQGHITAFTTNAFSMDFVVSAKNATQPLVIGLFESNLYTPGYRIAFEPGRSGEAAIILCTGNNNLVLVETSWPNINLADGKPHYIQWTRDWNGYMELYIDGALVIAVTDTYMNNRFEGVIIQSNGGDWAIESLYLADDS